LLYHSFSEYSPDNQSYTSYQEEKQQQLISATWIHHAKTYSNSFFTKAAETPAQRSHQTTKALKTFKVNGD
jgi:hypothetical protein